VGNLTENGLAPVRYSDSWRGERAAHFEAAQKKISFSFLEIVLRLLEN
jgi:hypothetical protein